MRQKFFSYLLIAMAIVIVFVPCVALAETENNEEIHEVNSAPMDDDDTEALSDHFMIKKTQDLSVPGGSITSLDISDKGEILVCFTSKIMVFDECFGPIRAYEIEWRKGDFPFAIWNKASGNIVCIRSDGYEFNEDGVIFREYDTIHEEKYRKTEAKWNGRTYELQNRSGWIELSTKRNKTYSTLVRIDENGLENVLYDATKWQRISQLISFFPIVFFIAVILIIITNERKKARLKRMQYGGSKDYQRNKRVRVKGRAKINGTKRKM